MLFQCTEVIVYVPFCRNDYKQSAPTNYCSDLGKQVKTEGLIMNIHLFRRIQKGWSVLLLWMVITTFLKLGVRLTRVSLGLSLPVEVEPVTRWATGVDLVTVLPLVDKTESVDAAHKFHRTVIVTVWILKQSFTDVSTVAPEDYPHIVIPVTAQLEIIQKTALLGWSTDDFLCSAAQAGALVNRASELILKFWPEFVHSGGDLWNVILVHDQWSGITKFGHHLLRRPLTKPSHVFVQKVVLVGRVVTLVIICIGSSNKSNYMTKLDL